MTIKERPAGLTEQKPDEQGIIRSPRSFKDRISALQLLIQEDE